MNWRETNDLYQRLMDRITFMDGLAVPVFYEAEGLTAHIAEGLSVERKNLLADVALLWREAWMAAGQPSPVPTLLPDLASYMDGLHYAMPEEVQL